MNSVTIKDILNLPDKSKVDCVQGLITEVYKVRSVLGGKNVQDAILRDLSGSEVKISVWEHPDISIYKGREVIIQAGPKGALTVKLDTYKQPNQNTLSISSTCTFQFLEVHSAQTGAQKPATASGTATAGVPANKYPDTKADGMRFGMCYKVASDYYLNLSANTGEIISVPDFIARIKELTPQLVQAAKDLEKGGEANPF